MSLHKEELSVEERLDKLELAVRSLSKKEKRRRQALDWLRRADISIDHLDENGQRKACLELTRNCLLRDNPGSKRADIEQSMVGAFGLLSDKMGMNLPTALRRLNTTMLQAGSSHRLTALDLLAELDLLPLMYAAIVEYFKLPFQQELL